MCTSPLRAFYTGSKTSKGGDLLAISKAFQGCEEVSYHEALKCAREPFQVNPKFMRLDHTSGYWFLYKYVDVPCGHCLECKEAYARSWAHRCIMEASYYPWRSWFITLTYDDEHNPGTVVKAHFQRFMKKLRKVLGPGVRFFACGEYGEHTHRPHYHAALFNCDLHINGFTAPEISKCWDLGFSRVSSISLDRCAYVARYTSKKLMNFPLSEKQEPPFLLMSRRPGIGERFLRDFASSIMDTDTVYLPDGNSVQSVKPPRYFYKLLEKDGISVIDFKDAHQVAAVINEISECSKRGCSRDRLLDGHRRFSEERRKRHERVL